MIIKTLYNGYELNCDICGHSVACMDSFDEAVGYKKRERMEKRKTQG